MQYVVKQPVLSLNEQMGNFYRESFSIMTKAANFGPEFMTDSIAQSALVVAIDMLAGALKTNMVKGEIVKHTSQHKISFYAHEASLTLAHFCNVISKTTGMTAQQIIMNLIIMDAKTQLKGSDAAVADIAYSLGFSTPTTFNRYFKTYTGMTPQEYRNNDNN